MAGDFKTALVSYAALAARNHGRAAALAGSMYLMGTGVRENGVKAMKYLEIGKNAGDLDAISLLGLAYATGKSGIRIDYIKARPLLEAAAKIGDEKALQMLQLMKSRQKSRR